MKKKITLISVILLILLAFTACESDKTGETIETFENFVASYNASSETFHDWGRLASNNESEPVTTIDLADASVFTGLKNYIDNIVQDYIDKYDEDGNWLNIIIKEYTANTGKITASKTSVKAENVKIEYKYITGKYDDAAGTTVYDEENVLSGSYTLNGTIVLVEEENNSGYMTVSGLTLNGKSYKDFKLNVVNYTFSATCDGKEVNQRLLKLFLE